MRPEGTPIAWPLRVWLGVEVLFGVAAVGAIGLAPADSQTNFAWPIQPVVMAAVLGAFYITSAPLFLLPLFARRWEMIRAMILPTAMFWIVQLGATILHWDKFSVGTVSFYVWHRTVLCVVCQLPLAAANLYRRILVASTKGCIAFRHRR